MPALEPVAPEGAFCLFCNISSLDGTSMDIAIRLLEEEGVAVTPGNAFGDAGGGYLRLSYATSRANLAEGLDRIEAFLTGR